MTAEIIKIDANTEIKVTRFGNGKLKSRIPYVNGVKHGTPQWWWGDGQKAWEEMWKCGKQHGLEAEWHANGKVESKTTYVNGEKHGLEESWWEDGAKYSVAMWRDGKKHGMYIGWDNGGQKWVEVMWRVGKVYGRSINWHENGQKWSEEMRRTDKRHGMDTYWYENAQKATERYYIRGKEYAQIEWDNKGNITKTNFPRPSITTTRKPCKPQKARKSKKITSTCG